MPRFFFRKYLNGQLFEDARGHRYADEDTACRYALNQVAAFISKANTFPNETRFSIEVTEGERTVCFVRVSLRVERYDRQPEIGS
jgi:hypothetical protein